MSVVNHSIEYILATTINFNINSEMQLMTLIALQLFSHMDAPMFFCKVQLVSAKSIDPNGKQICLFRMQSHITDRDFSIRIRAQF